MRHLYSLDESVNPFSKGAQSFPVEFNAIPKQDGVTSLAPVEQEAIVWARNENEITQILGQHYHKWSGLVIKTNPSRRKTKYRHNRQEETLKHIFITENPFGNGNQSFLVTFTLPESGPIPSMLNEGVMFRHPAETIKAVVWATSKENINEVLNYHYRGWGNLEVVKEVRGSKPQRKLARGLGCGS